MLLTARPLLDVCSVNAFRFAENFHFTAGDGPLVYFQLIDLSVDPELRPPGRRYVPAVGAVLSCTVQNINDAVAITRLATQPFTQDPSIWALQFMPTDTISGTANLRLVLTEGLKVTGGIRKQAFRIEPASNLDGVIPTPLNPLLLP